MRTLSKKPQVIIRRSSLKKKNVDRFLDCGIEPELVEKILGMSIDDKKKSEYSYIQQAKNVIIAQNYFVDEDVSDDNAVEVSIKVSDTGMITQDVSMREIVTSCKEIENKKQET
jgi:hypothetical protein